MPSFAKLVWLATLAAVSSATTISAIMERSATHVHHCSGAKVSHSTSVNVDGKSVTRTTYHCDKPPGAPPARRTPTDVCGELCRSSCNDNAGSLPPISDDCQTIQDAIQIFSQELSTFVVDAYGLEALTYGTCTYSFSNDCSDQLQYCWADLGTTASRAGDACYPPVQPFYSEGLCSSYDGTWAISSAHS